METHEVAILIGHDRSEVSEVLTHLIEQILLHSERTEPFFPFTVIRCVV